MAILLSSQLLCLIFCGTAASFQSAPKRHALLDSAGNSKPGWPYILMVRITVYTILWATLSHYT